MSRTGTRGDNELSPANVERLKKAVLEFEPVDYSGGLVNCPLTLSSLKVIMVTNLFNKPDLIPPSRVQLNAVLAELVGAKAIVECTKKGSSPVYFLAARDDDDDDAEEEHSDAPPPPPPPQW